MSWLDENINEYFQWIREKTTVYQDENTQWSVISTPFLGAFNDNIDIYAKKEGGKILLSDNGETLSNLELQGVNMLSPKSKNRRQILDMVLQNYGILLVGEELLVETDNTRFSQAKHNLLSSILEISSFYTLSKSNINSVFKEDIASYFNEIGIVFTTDFISKGLTGLEFNFDFQIAKRGEEIVLKSFNTLNNNLLSSFLFSWEDIKPVREKSSKKEVKAIAIINDVERDIKDEYIEALKSKKADYILWSERREERNKKLLVA